MNDSFDDPERYLERSPRVFGVVRAVVTNNQDDPYKLGRCKVSFINLPQKAESAWARVLTPMAGNKYGLSMMPNVDDEVLVAFEQGDIDKPLIIGALWNGENPPPYVNEDGRNNVRQIVSRSGHTLKFDDTDKAWKLVISDKTKKNIIEFDSAKNTISISSEGDVEISAKGNLKLKASKAVSVDCESFSVSALGTAKLAAKKSLALDCMPGGIYLNNNGLVVK